MPEVPLEPLVPEVPLVELIPEVPPVPADPAAELFPEEARIISLQGAVYASQGMTQRALGCSDYALSLGGFEPLIWVLRGIILSLADNSNAAACFSKAMEIRSADDWLTPMRIGLHLLREKKWQSSAEHLHAAAEISKSNDYLWERLGYANEALSLTNSAVEAYRAALQINSTNARAEAGLRRLCNTPFFTRIFRRILG
ncbi:MAG: hypothetical protein NTY46_00285 [Candidatus Sumerlaeota bacterium]|nr:hypothetical protein [Candidatus Sumerlaeota bacterium]